MMKKILYCIFTCLASFFLMSHNTSALSPDAGTVNVYWSFETVMTYCSKDAQWKSASCILNPDTSTGVNAIKFAPQVAKNIEVGEYWVEAYISFTSAATNQAPIVTQAPTSSNRGSIASFESVSSTTRGSTTVRIYRVLIKWSSSTNISTSNPIQISSSNNWVSTGGYQVTSVTFYRVNAADATNQQIINSINSQSSSINSIKDTIINQQNQDNQDRQDTQTTIEDSKNTSNSSSSDVQNNSSTQSLLSVITGFFGAITSASPSSCVLTGQINEYLTPSFDLCQLDPPPALTALLSIPVAIALFFFAKHMLNKIVALIRSFQ